MLVGNLMRQLECLLHEYLSFNWHHSDAVLRSNQDVLQCVSPPCTASGHVSMDAALHP